jgi:poly-gamma-glutamate capsule biosynthesis protein CapA/YwtB (metallophosphatase superfamily)
VFRNAATSLLVFLLLAPGCSKIGVVDPPPETSLPAVVEAEPITVEPEQEPTPEMTTEPRGPTITVVATGDIMLGGTGREFYHRDNYDYAFVNVRDILLDADIFIGNVETALTTSDELLVEKKYRFRDPPGPVSAALARAGLDVANLGNNHSLDYGHTGLAQTLEALHGVGVKTIGAGATDLQARRAAVISVADRRLGFLAYSNTFPEEFWADEDRPGTAFGHERNVREDVAALKAFGIDNVLVSFHWGREGTTELRDYQPLLAYAAIDAGADVVIGHHPHILQAVEKYKQGVIFYSLGNFTFGSYSPAAQDSAIARIEFVDGQLQGVELIPIDVFNQRVLFQPRLLRGENARRVVTKLQALSAMRGTQLQSIADRAVLKWPDPAQ